MPASSRKLAEPQAQAHVQAQAQSQTELLRVLAHPLRLRLLWLLCDEPMHVNCLAEKLGKGQAIVSQQLRILRMAGLVESSRSHGFAYYRIADADRRELLRGIQDLSGKLSLVLHGR